MATPTPFRVWAEVNETTNGHLVVTLYKQQVERGPVSRLGRRKFRAFGKRANNSRSERVATAEAWGLVRANRVKKGLYATVIEGGS